MVLKEEESVMKTFKVLTQIGSSDFPDLHDKLLGFFQKTREMDAASAVASSDSSSKALQKLSLLKVSFGDQILKQQCEVQKIEKLEHELAELEMRTRDLCVQIQEQQSIVCQLDIETTSTS
ncbi:hypothetical protein LIER_16936 [Lithospermum erythrorhizon]|uniref:Uncharacterized protein n=1 Tax=Lithospermum erythrorhizon TaxID=34254 RepID=A0AAV3Q8I5_LITER